MALPTEWDGSRDKMTTFLNEVELYLAMNAHVFDTDKKKIIFTLSFMNQGTAGPWKEAKMADHDTGVFYGTWADFKVKLKKNFEPADFKGDTLTKLRLLQQSGTAEF